jgi:hypothetical protein|tara:strand:- start:184475 stop:184687 length:213 start_codon:yes stop_codon:yes gene_type:complete
MAASTRNAHIDKQNDTSGITIAIMTVDETTMTATTQESIFMYLSSVTDIEGLRAIITKNTITAIARPGWQ